jgi:hypothetical protein
VIPTRYPQTKRHSPAHGGTAATIDLLALTSRYAGSRGWRGSRSRMAQGATELLVSGRSAVRIRSPAPSISDVRKPRFAEPGKPPARCAQRLSVPGCSRPVRWAGWPAPVGIHCIHHEIRARSLSSRTKAIGAKDSGGRRWIVDINWRGNLSVPAPPHQRPDHGAEQ